MKEVIPLYKLAAMHSLPDNQYLDKGTIDWISANRPDFGVRILYRELISELGDVYLTLRKIIPLQSDIFARNTLAQDTLHGELHAYRVAIFAGLLARTLLSEDPSSYILSGLYHDIARLNDTHDRGHGVRSAERVGSLSLIPNHPLKDIILNAIAEHEDEKTTEDADMHIKILKVSDALDRFRLPRTKWWPDVQRMPIAPSRELVQLAYELVLRSEKLALCASDNVNALDGAIKSLVSEGSNESV